MKDPNLLYGTNLGDDSGVYRLREDLAIVQTIDFFTPIVDDAYDFGQIAAANALSDCFALGARPLTGLNMVCYPKDFGLEILGEILKGGADKMLEAGGVIVGGHSVEDPEPKYGIAVTGIVDPRKMITNCGAKPGDALILTKKIGTGIVTNMHKIKSGLGKLLCNLSDGFGKCAISEGVYDEVVESMKTLNQRPSELMLKYEAHACTDVTGFGLLGHAYNLAEASGVMLEISYHAVPKFEGIEDYSLPGTKGGGDRNAHWVNDKVELGEGIGRKEFAVLCDAQTSGPFLIAVSESDAEPFVAEMHSAGLRDASVIGHVADAQAGRIRVLP